MADSAEPEDLQGKAANSTATAEPARVLISYASQDRAVADAACGALYAPLLFDALIANAALWAAVLISGLGINAE